MILINGQVIESLPITDRALHYGDGLFETILVRDGAPRLWEQHLARLQRSCQRLALSFDAAALMQDLATVLSDGSSGVLKIIISRGSGGRGYAPPQDPQPTRIVQLHSLPPGNELKAQQGVSLHDIKALAGHSSVAVTEIYAHHQPSYGRAAVPTMGAWGRRR